MPDDEYDECCMNGGLADDDGGGIVVGADVADIVDGAVSHVDMI